MIIYLYVQYISFIAKHLICHLICFFYSKFCFFLLRDKDQFSRRKWEELNVGDIVCLSCDEVIPADILILESSDPNNICYIQTSNLDGETTLKQREVPCGILDQREPDVSIGIVFHYFCSMVEQR